MAYQIGNLSGLVVAFDYLEQLLSRNHTIAIRRVFQQLTPNSLERLDSQQMGEVVQGLCKAIFASLQEVEQVYLGNLRDCERGSYIQIMQELEQRNCMTFPTCALSNLSLFHLLCAFYGVESTERLNQTTVQCRTRLDFLLKILEKNQSCDSWYQSQFKGFFSGVSARYQCQSLEHEGSAHACGWQQHGSYL